MMQGCLRVLYDPNSEQRQFPKEEPLKDSDSQASLCLITNHGDANGSNPTSLTATHIHPYCSHHHCDHPVVAALQQDFAYELNTPCQEQPSNIRPWQCCYLGIPSFVVTTAILLCLRYMEDLILKGHDPLSGWNRACEIA
jgi:hypothetical protein